jgi:hypothetical protein
MAAAKESDSASSRVREATAPNNLGEDAGLKRQLKARHIQVSHFDQIYVDQLTHQI